MKQIRKIRKISKKIRKKLETFSLSLYHFLCIFTLFLSTSVYIYLSQVGRKEGYRALWLAIVF